MRTLRNKMDKRKHSYNDIALRFKSLDTNESSMLQLNIIKQTQTKNKKTEKLQTISLALLNCQSKVKNMENTSKEAYYYYFFFTSNQ